MDLAVVRFFLFLLIVTVGARMLAMAVMAGVYITINAQNYLVFAGAAIVCGVVGMICIIRFNHMRILYVVRIPLVVTDGSQLQNAQGRLQFENVVIGKEEEINAEAKEHFKQAKRTHAGLTLLQFMGGYGTPPNNPEALWSRNRLARLSNKLTILLIWIALLGVIVIYVGAFVIEIYNRSQ